MSLFASLSGFNIVEIFSQVFNLENQTLQYTLHGHYGPVTCAFIDRSDTSLAGSGSQDGLLCVWDLHTGTPREFFFSNNLIILVVYTYGVSFFRSVYVQYSSA